MKMTTARRFPIRKSLTLGLVLTIALSVDFHHHVNCTPGENDIWSKYRPVAMDESWSVNEMPGYAINPNSRPWVKDQTRRPHPNIWVDWQSRTPDVLADQAIAEPLPVALPAQIPSPGGELLDVEQYQGQNVQDLLFKAPTQETSTLTKLVASGQTPTFLDEQLKMPEFVAPDAADPTRKDRVLARYKFIVPIYIPAIKLKKKAPPPPPGPVKFVKEQQIEMVPVKQVSTQVKEVIKAERVPQQLVTDFVQETSGNSVPAQVDDKVNSDERVVSSVVQNFD